jgi:PAS domain S-box-containing protein
MEDNNQKNSKFCSKSGLTDDSSFIHLFEDEYKNITGSSPKNLATIKDCIEELKNYYENIIALMPNNVYWLDKNLILRGCNNRVADLCGLPREQCIGLDYSQISKLMKLDRGQADSFKQDDIEVIKTGKPKISVEEPPLPGENGEAVSYYISSRVPMKNHNGDVIGVIGISTDITARKKAEEELKQAKEIAESANKAKTAFLENMRHDLRTSLSGIQGFSELIKKEVQKEGIDVKDHVNNLVASCRALTNIHNQILRAVRVFSGEVPSYRSKFDIRSKLRQVVNLNLAKAGEKGLKLSYYCDDDIPRYLIGDCKRLSGIALELTANALKYTDTGSVLLSIKIDKKTNDRFVIKFIVQDTGIGIPKDKKSEIFSRFGRLSPSYEGRYSGLGLGLSIVKQFIDEMHGEIYVSSEPGIGSTFTCYIPLYESLSGEDVEDDDLLDDEDIFFTKQETSIRPIASCAQPTADGGNVLLVEDEKLCAMIAEAILSDLGKKVDIAKSGEEALKKSCSNNYEIIFMDIGLPDINGNEVTRKIRLSEKLTKKHVPIVALTAHVDNDNRQLCIESGMDAVLTKPVTQSKIEDVLKAFVSMPCNEVDFIHDAQSKDLDDSSLLRIEGKTIDFEYNEKLYRGKADYKALFKLVSDSFANHIIELKAAYEKQDWKALNAAAHKITGGSSYCGAMRLNNACHNLEKYLYSGKTELISKLYNLILHEEMLLEEAIKYYLERGKISQA